MLKCSIGKVKAFPSVQVGRYYVFVDYIVYCGGERLYAIAHTDLCGSAAEPPYNKFLNPVDGFIQYAKSQRMESKHHIIVELDLADVARINELLG